MGELAPLGTGAAGDGVTAAPVPKPGPGSEGTATAVVASLQGCGSLSKSVGDAPPISQPASAMGGIQLQSCIHGVQGVWWHPLPAASSLSKPQIKYIN